VTGARAGGATEGRVSLSGVLQVMGLVCVDVGVHGLVKGG